MGSDPRIGMFVAATLLLLYISRASLRKPRSHGFYRFFAWEAILGLTLINVPLWFRHWLSWNQIVSWIVLMASIIPLVLGVDALRRRGEADRSARADTTLLAFERTTRLVTAGVFRYIRHPMYSSLLLLTWGIFFKNPSPVGTILACVSTVFLLLTAKADEAECLEVFGSEYRDYMRRTRMLIPYVV
jgi:protein-S-isoprenylcysteine O-methyltransferase Ste14